MNRRFAIVIGTALGLVVAAASASSGESSMREDARDRAAIEELHRRDVEATLSGDPKALAELWTENAVRLEQGRPPDVGRAAIRAVDERSKTEHPGARIVRYSPDIKDVTIRDGFAFEWGTFSGRYVDGTGGEEKPFEAKVLRVLEKQSDGTWRFARVMWNTNE